MMRLKDVALYHQDFEALKALAEDLKKVFDLGHDIFKLERELTIAVSKEDYAVAMDLKQKLQIVRVKRDGYDALYETTRYEQMVVFDRPSTADYQRNVD